MLINAKAYTELIESSKETSKKYLKNEIIYVRNYRNQASSFLASIRINTIHYDYSRP